MDSAPWMLFTCQYPRSVVPFVLYKEAYCLPPDSAMAISAARNAERGDPPADSHRASRPRQDRVPPWAVPVMAASAVAVFAVLALHHPGGQQLAAARGGTLGCPGLERLWEQAGGPPAAARLAASVAMAESGGRQYAALVNANGTTDRGYWQINSVHGSLSTFGAYANARAAVLISSSGRDWTPWVTYNSGAYAGRC